MEKPRKTAQIALLLGIVGAIWVIFRGNPAAFFSMKFGAGDGIFFAGTIALSIYGTLVKFLHRGEPMAQMTFWTLVISVLWLLVLVVPRLSGIVWTDVPIAVYSGIAYLAMFTTLITFFVFRWSTPAIGSTKIMSHTYLNPILVLILRVDLGQDYPPLTIYPGLTLIIVATIILLRSKPNTD